jgi:hypothetical protein
VEVVFTPLVEPTVFGEDRSIELRPEQGRGRRLVARTDLIENSQPAIKNHRSREKLLELIRYLVTRLVAETSIPTLRSISPIVESSGLGQRVILRRSNRRANCSIAAVRPDPELGAGATLASKQPASTRLAWFRIAVVGFLYKGL